MADEPKPANPKPEGPKPNRKMQYLAAIAASLGAFALGTIIGWASPASDILRKKYNFNTEELSWIMSVMPLGAAMSSPCVVFMSRSLGNKMTMILIAIPFVIGWIFLYFSPFATFIVGRIILGFCGGTFCYCAPVFVGEIAEAKIRGRLGVFFQLMVVLGILFSYALGIPENLWVLNVPVTIVPGVPCIVLIFMHASPIALLKKGKEDKAIEALKFYRGKDYPVEKELGEMKEYIRASAMAEGTSRWKEIRSKPVTKGFLLTLMMHFIQQLSGINVIMFYAGTISKMTKMDLPNWVTPVCIGGVQIVATVVSIVLIERAGRKLLWLISLSLMALCLIVVGVFFFMHNRDPDSASKFSYVPSIAICLYIVGFSLGAGPLPWALLGELLADSVKNILGPICVFVNWLLAFLVTISFNPMVEHLGAHTTFWIYSGVCVIGAVLIGIFFFETKGLTLAEVQKRMGA